MTKRTDTSRIPQLAIAALVLTLAAALWGFSPAASAGQINLSTIANFGPNLSATSPEPEGIAVDPNGNVYASSIPIGPGGVIGGVPTATISVINRSGQLVKKIPVPAGPSGAVALVGELFLPGHGLYVIDAADSFTNPATTAGRILLVDPATDAVSVVAQGFVGPNALTADRQGNLYVADGIAGTITEMRPDGSHRHLWFSDHARLGPAAGNFLGANGLAFSPNHHVLYVTNPGTESVYAITTAGPPSTRKMTLFGSGQRIDRRQKTQEALIGADGLEVDTNGDVWVCADWVNQLQELSPSGRLIARYSGDRTNALHNPASLVFLGRQLFISNLDFFGATPGVNSKVSEMTTQIPGVTL